jgi:hypothetical protein
MLRHIGLTRCRGDQATILVYVTSNCAGSSTSYGWQAGFKIANILSPVLRESLVERILWYFFGCGVRVG